MTKDLKVTDYNKDLQKIFIQCMMSDRDTFTQTKPVIDPAYFHSSLRESVKYIIDYSEEYNDLPTPEQIKAYTQLDITPLGEKDAQRLQKWYINEIEEFCRHKAIEQVVLDGPNFLAQGKYGDLEAAIKEAIMISLNRDVGTNYFEDPKARLTDMVNNSGRISTGWNDIDRKLYGGFAPGELNIFAAGSGGGKSLFLQNLAINWVNSGKFVVYISLELSEHLVTSRMDSMFTGMHTREITKKIDDVDLAVRQIYRKMNGGELFVKKMPEGGTTVNTIKAYLKELQIQTGRKPDALLVDYLDLMSPNRKGIDFGNLNIKDKYVSEELRALASEMDLLLGTASQLNRGASEENGDYEHHHIAGGLSKIQTADNVIAIYRNPTMIEHGQFQVKFLKTRSAAGVGQRCMLEFNNDTLRITDDTSQQNTGIASTGNASATVQALSNLNKGNQQSSSPPPENKKKQDALSIISKINNGQF